MALAATSRAGWPRPAPRSYAALGLLALALSGCAPRLGSPPAAAAVPPREAPTAVAPGADLGLQFWLPAASAPPVLAVEAPLLPIPLPVARADGDGAPSRARSPIPERDLDQVLAPPPEAQRYTLLPGVALSPAVQQKVAEIADAYFRRTGRELVVTSGTRDPERQAGAMHALFRRGADVLGLYKDKEAAREIKTVYEHGLSVEQPAGALVAAMTQVIHAQIERGVFISAHLREGAVDIRSRDMTPEEKHAFLAGAEEVGGVVVLEESRPPHYHLQLQ